MSKLVPAPLTTDEMKDSNILKEYGIVIGNGWLLDNDYNNGYPYYGILRKFETIVVPDSACLIAMNGQGLSEVSYTNSVNSITKFVFTGTTVTVPSIKDESFNAATGVIYWGDGTTSDYTSSESASHTYPASGAHEVYLHCYYDNIAELKANNFIAIDISPSVRRIASSAFYGNGTIASVYIPPTVEYIGEGAFLGTALTNVLISKDCTYFSNSFPIGCTIEYYPIDTTGVNDYEYLDNKPSINGHELLGTMDDESIGIQGLSNEDIEDLLI